jgi:hypothetical protein
LQRGLRGKAALAPDGQLVGVAIGGPRQRSDVKPIDAEFALERPTAVAGRGEIAVPQLSAAGAVDHAAEDTEDIMALQLYRPSATGTPLTGGEAASPRAVHGVWRRLARWLTADRPTGLASPPAAQPTRRPANTCETAQEADYAAAGAELDYTIALAFLLML